jgi:predicted transcriptional regulator
MIGMENNHHGIMMIEFNKNEENITRILYQNELIEEKVNGISNEVSNNQKEILQIMDERLNSLENKIDDQCEAIKNKVDINEAETEQTIMQLGWNGIQIIRTEMDRKATEQQNLTYSIMNNIEVNREETKQDMNQVMNTGIKINEGIIRLEENNLITMKKPNAIIVKTNESF